MEREGSRSPSSTARLKGVPGVGVRVELHEGQRAVYGRRGPDLRKCYGVVAPEHYRDDAGAVYGLQPFLYALVTGLDVSRHHGHVAVVYDREVIEDSDPQARVVAPEEVRDAADTLGTKSCPGPEGGADVEGGADYRNVGVLEVLRVG